MNENVSTNAGKIRVEKPVGKCGKACGLIVNKPRELCMKTFFYTHFHKLQNRFSTVFPQSYPRSFPQMGKSLKKACIEKKVKG